MAKYRIQTNKETGVLKGAGQGRVAAKRSRGYGVAGLVCGVARLACKVASKGLRRRGLASPRGLELRRKGSVLAEGVRPSGGV